MIFHLLLGDLLILFPTRDITPRGRLRSEMDLPVIAFKSIVRDASRRYEAVERWNELAHYLTFSTFFKAERLGHVNALFGGILDASVQ